MTAADSSHADLERLIIGSVLQSQAGGALAESIVGCLNYAEHFVDQAVAAVATAIRRAAIAGNAPSIAQVSAELSGRDLVTLSELFGSASTLPIALAEIEAEKLLPALRKCARKGTSKAISIANEYFGENGDETLCRLAGLPPLEYERAREKAAEQLGCRTGILDRLVDAKRPKSDGELQGRAVELPEIEQWPDPVDGAEVLAGVSESFSRYVFLPDGAADTLALWCGHAHAFKCFLCSPRLNIRSEQKGCGKTTCRDVVSLFVPRPLQTENLSVPVLFRLVEAYAPTILADECDAWLRDNEELRGLLNAGHRRGAVAYRCEGDNHEVRSFRVFAPAALAGIGALTGTLHDRSISIHLERAKLGEMRARFDSRNVQRETELCRKLARWCADNSAHLQNSDPALPSGVFNRIADNWRPLFAMAELLGSDWPRRAADAFAKVRSREDSDSQGLNVMLLEDVRQAFDESHTERMFSKALLQALFRMTDRPWSEAHHGKPITETWLARKLKTFGVGPKTVRLDLERAKGYSMDDLAEAFARYLPIRDSVTTQAGVQKTDFSSRDGEAACHGSITHESHVDIDLSRCHGSQAPAELML